MAVWGSKPIGSAAWAPVFLRVGVGFYFILLGMWGLDDFESFSLAMQKYSGFSGVLLQVYAAVAPFLLVAVGALLILGLWTVATAMLTILLLLPLFYGAGLFEKQPDMLARRSLYKDACLLGACVALLFTGGGILSLDRLMKADK
jgi:uncharacterized membrane protein YphA (DoxX/SURF4 family)